MEMSEEGGWLPPKKEKNSDDKKNFPLFVLKKTPEQRPGALLPLMHEADGSPADEPQHSNQLHGPSSETQIQTHQKP